MGAPGLRDPNRKIAGTPGRSGLAAATPAGQEPRLKVENGELFVSFGRDLFPDRKWRTLPEMISALEAKNLPGLAKVINELKALNTEAQKFKEIPLPDSALASFAQARQILADKVAASQYLRSSGNPHFAPSGRTWKPKPLESDDVQGLARRTKDRTALLGALYNTKQYKALDSASKKVINKAITQGTVSVPEVDAILKRGINATGYVDQSAAVEHAIQKFVAAKSRGAAETRFTRDVGGSAYRESAPSETMPPGVSDLIDEAKRILKSSKSGRQVADSVTTLFSRVDANKNISDEIKSSIKNRVVEMLMRTDFAGDALQALALPAALEGGRLVQSVAGAPISEGRRSMFDSINALLGMEKSKLDPLDLSAAREGAALRGHSFDARRLPGAADINPTAPGTNPLLALLRLREPRARTQEPQRRAVSTRRPLKEGEFRARPPKPSTSKATDPMPLRSTVRGMIPPASEGTPDLPGPPTAMGVTAELRQFALLQNILKSAQGLKIPPNPLAGVKTVTIPKGVEGPIGPGQRRQKIALTPDQDARLEAELPPVEPSVPRMNILPTPTFRSLVEAILGRRVPAKELKKLHDSILKAGGLPAAVKQAGAEVKERGIRETVDVAPPPPKTSQLRDLYDYLMKFGPGRNLTRNEKSEYSRKLIEELQRP